MKKLLFFFSLLLMASSCGSRAQTDVTESILWKITGNGTDRPSYLLGTHHFASLDILDQYPGYKKALDESHVIVAELDMDDAMASQSVMMDMAVLPDGITYRDLLSEQECEKLDRLLSGMFGAGLAQFGNFKPAMVQTMYAAITYIKANPSFNPMAHVAIDAYVQELGKEQGKQIIGLETMEQQASVLLDSDPLELQAATLLCILENDGDSIEQQKEFDKLYREGRLEELYDMSFNNPEDPCPTSEEFNRAICKTRNDNWMTVIPGIIAENQAFIAVGALHLAGEEGLINQLRELGFTVEPIR